MEKKIPFFQSMGHAILAALYVGGVAWMLYNGDRLFGQVQNFWGPVFLLLLFVFSACIVGGLVLGKPILMYLDGRKKEALAFFGYTLWWLFIILIIVFLFHFLG